MSLSAGDLNRRVLIQRRNTTTDAVYGSRSTQWVDVATVWAQISPMGGQEVLLAEAIKSKSTHQVTMRYRTNIDPTCRIVYQGRYFDINSMNDVDTAHEYLQLMCTEGVSEGG